MAKFLARYHAAQTAEEQAQQPPRATIELEVMYQPGGRYTLMQKLPNGIYVELFGTFDKETFYIDVMAKLVELKAEGRHFDLNDGTSN